MGRMDEARDASKDVAEGPRRDQLRILLAEPSASAEALERLQSDPLARSRFLLAEIAAFENDPDAAFAWLEEAVHRMQAAGDDVAEFSASFEVLLSPFLRPLHDDPRWERLLAQLPIS
jgi:phosphoserine phosphatase